MGRSMARSPKPVNATGENCLNLHVEITVLPRRSLHQFVRFHSSFQVFSVMLRGKFYRSVVVGSKPEIPLPISKEVEGARVTRSTSNLRSYMQLSFLS